MKKQSGITLIALIITIVVMLILVAVTLMIALGENGVVQNTRKASKETEIQAIYEQIVGAMDFANDGGIDVKETYNAAKSTLEAQGKTIELKFPQVEGEISTEVMFEVTGVQGTYTYSIDTKEIVIGTLWMTQEEAEKLYSLKYNGDEIEITEYLANEEVVIIPSRILLNNGILATVTKLNEDVFAIGGSDDTEESLREEAELVNGREFAAQILSSQLGIAKEELTLGDIGVTGDEQILQIKILTDNDSEKKIVIEHLINIMGASDNYFIWEGDEAYVYIRDGNLIPPRWINNKLRKIVIPETIQSIGAHLASRNEKLEEVTFLMKSDWEGYSSYGLFYDCDNLMKIRFPNLTMQEVKDKFSGENQMFGAYTQGKIICSDGTIDLSETN